MDIKLIIDDRERAVTLHKEDLNNINYEITRLTTADYVVVNASTGTAIAAIERKSLEDFAASIKDGRSENIKKLCDFRAKSGCRIIYLIEGDAFPRQDKQYAHIAYKTIESAIFHLIARDNICVIRTKDTVDTAKTLVRFVQSMKTLKEEFEPITELPTEIKVGNAELTQMITEKHVRNDIDIVRDMWASFKGISLSKSDEYINRWSLSDLFKGWITRDSIIAMKYSNGRAIDKKIANELFAPSHITQRKILSQIPMISYQATEVILSNMNLRELISLDQEKLSKVRYNDKKCIGKHAAAIIRLFDFTLAKPVVNTLTDNILSINVLAKESVIIEEVKPIVMNKPKRKYQRKNKMTEEVKEEII